MKQEFVLVQGYYYHKPESLEQILHRLTAGKAVKECETRQERDQMNRKWFEEYEVGE